MDNEQGRPIENYIKLLILKQNDSHNLLKCWVFEIISFIF